jgi:hypothetical protein
MAAIWSSSTLISRSTVVRFSLSWRTAAAEMREVVQIISIAEELKSEFDAVAPFCNELVQLAEDFDFDSIQKLLLELGN